MNKSNLKEEELIRTQGSRGRRVHHSRKAGKWAGMVARAGSREITSLYHECEVCTPSSQPP